MLLEDVKTKLGIWLFSIDDKQCEKPMSRAKFNILRHLRCCARGSFCFLCHFFSTGDASVVLWYVIDSSNLSSNLLYIGSVLSFDYCIMKMFSSFNGTFIFFLFLLARRPLILINWSAATPVSDAMDNTCSWLMYGKDGVWLV